MPFSCFNYQKNKLCRFLIWQLLCGWWVTTADQFHPSVCTCTIDFSIGTVCYYPDKEIDQDVTCGMSANIFSIFFAVGTVLSTCLFYRQVIIDHRCWSAVVTSHSQSNCLMRNRCGLIFKSKSWKLTLKYLKLCSGNPKFFRSITLNSVYLSSI